MLRFPSHLAAISRAGTGEDSAPVQIYYEDHGAGRTVALVRGFPLSGRAWLPRPALCPWCRASLRQG